MTDVKAELETTLKALDQMIAAVRERWAYDHEPLDPDQYPTAEQAVDQTGRPLLADLIVARANVLVALGRMGA